MDNPATNDNAALLSCGYIIIPHSINS